MDFNCNILKFVIIFLFYLGITNVKSQLIYPVVGTYNNKSAQGMVIFENKAYLFNDGGHCRVFDLQTSTVIREFDLASSSKDCHVNNVCLGAETPKGRTVPLMYITEYNGEMRCLVEDIGNDSVPPSLLQAISYHNGKGTKILNWTVDIPNRWLYALYTLKMNKTVSDGVVNRILKFHLPKITDGNNIVLTPDHIIEQFDVAFSNGVQGGKIRDGYWYIAAGLQETARARFDSERAIVVIDLKKRCLQRKIDLNLITVNEPEDIDFFKKKMLLYCGQNGGLYEVTYKK